MAVDETRQERVSIRDVDDVQLGGCCFFQSGNVTCAPCHALNHTCKHRHGTGVCAARLQWSFSSSSPQRQTTTVHAAVIMYATGGERRSTTALTCRYTIGVCKVECFVCTSQNIHCMCPLLECRVTVFLCPHHLHVSASQRALVLRVRRSTLLLRAPARRALGRSSTRTAGAERGPRMAPSLHAPYSRVIESACLIKGCIELTTDKLQV